MKRKGFTLIELLVVVAIISILAAIALPNFLEAQTRSKVSKVKSDMRTLVVGLEAYSADCNSYPPMPMGLGPDFRGFRPLTTPVAYLTSIPSDQFESRQPSKHFHRSDFAYGGSPIDKPVTYAIASNGPDLQADFPLLELAGFVRFKPLLHTDYLYDPTNGSVSRGDLIRTHDYVQ